MSYSNRTRSNSENHAACVVRLTAPPLQLSKGGYQWMASCDSLSTNQWVYDLPTPENSGLRRWITLSMCSLSRQWENRMLRLLSSIALANTIFRSAVVRWAWSSRASGSWMPPMKPTWYSCVANVHSTPSWLDILVWDLLTDLPETLWFLLATNCARCTRLVMCNSSLNRFFHLVQSLFLMLCLRFCLAHHGRSKVEFKYTVSRETGVVPTIFYYSQFRESVFLEAVLHYMKLLHYVMDDCTCSKLGAFLVDQAIWILKDLATSRPNCLCHV